MYFLTDINWCATRKRSVLSSLTMNMYFRAEQFFVPSSLLLSLTMNMYFHIEMIPNVSPKRDFHSSLTQYREQQMCTFPLMLKGDPLWAICLGVIAHPIARTTDVHLSTYVKRRPTASDMFERVHVIIQSRQSCFAGAKWYGWNVHQSSC